MRAALAAARIGFAHVLAFRAEVAVQLVSALLVAGLNGSLWRAATAGRAQVAGVPADEMMSYVVIAWVSVSFVATRVNEDVGRRVRDGQIASDLLRPMSFPLQCYARDLGRAFGTLLVQTTPLFVVTALLFPTRLPERPSTWLLWLASLVLAHAVNFGLSFLVGIAALPLHEVTGLTHLKSTLVSVFSGALVPLELFGPTLRTVAFALPFHAMAWAPASVFLERDLPLLEVLGSQAAWALAMNALAALGWRAAAHTLTVQGG